MKKILVVSGCSWTEHFTTSSISPNVDHNFPRWPQVLADKLNMDVINVSRSGAGNEFIYNRMIDTLCTTKNVHLAICLWSGFDRWDFYNSSFQLTPKFKDGKRENIFKGVRLFHAFQNHCQLNKIPFLQMQGFMGRGIENPLEWDIEALFSCAQFDIINDKNYIGWPIFKQLGGETMNDNLNKNDSSKLELRISFEDTHPNNKGHELMAEIFYDNYRSIYS